MGDIATKIVETVVGYVSSRGAVDVDRIYIELYEVAHLRKMVAISVGNDGRSAFNEVLGAMLDFLVHVDEILVMTEGYKLKLSDQIEIRQD